MIVTQSLRPFVKYPGGKTREQTLIKKYVPREIDRYFEPFVGGGSTFFNMRVSNSFINDLSRDLVILYRYVKKGNSVFINTLKSLNRLWKISSIEGDLDSYLKDLDMKDLYKQHYASLLKRKMTFLNMRRKSEISSGSVNEHDAIETVRKGAIYNSVRDLYNLGKDNPEHIAFFFFIREYCYSSMFRFSKNNTFNVPYGGLSYNRKSLDKKIDYITSREVRHCLKNTVIENMDFENFLRMYAPNHNDFVFLDPPYDSNFSTYDGNSFDIFEQKRLQRVLSSSKANWMLVIKKTEFIKELYVDFSQIEYDKNYLVSFKNRNNKRAQHLIIVNYEVDW